MENYKFVICNLVIIIIRIIIRIIIIIIMHASGGNERV